jgi:hypothetical protein
MDVWRVVRVSLSNNGLPSQDDQESGRFLSTIHHSQSHGESRRDNVIYMGKMRYSSVSVDDLALLNEGQILEKEGKARGKEDVS